MTNSENDINERIQRAIQELEKDIPKKEKFPIDESMSSIQIYDLDEFPNIVECLSERDILLNFSDKMMQIDKTLIIDFELLQNALHNSDAKYIPIPEIKSDVFMLAVEYILLTKYESTDAQNERFSKKITSTPFKYGVGIQLTTCFDYLMVNKKLLRPFYIKYINPKLHIRDRTLNMQIDEYLYFYRKVTPRIMQVLNEGICYTKEERKNLVHRILNKMPFEEQLPEFASLKVDLDELERKRKITLIHRAVYNWTLEDDYTRKRLFWMKHANALELVFDNDKDSNQTLYNIMHVIETAEAPSDDSDIDIPDLLDPTMVKVFQRSNNPKIISAYEYVKNIVYGDYKENAVKEAVERCLKGMPLKKIDQPLIVAEIKKRFGSGSLEEQYAAGQYIIDSVDAYDRELLEPAFPIKTLDEIEDQFIIFPELRLLHNLSYFDIKKIEENKIRDKVYRIGEARKERSRPKY